MENLKILQLLSLKSYLQNFVIASISEVMPMADPPRADNLRAMKTN